MKDLRGEIDANFERFSAAWPNELTAVRTVLGQHLERYKVSYQKLVSLQAWRTTLLDTLMSKESLAFFLEAQNDALVSHVMAELGSWRVALQSLRSTIENVLSALYYMDHPVELQLWQLGQHKLGFSALADYLEHHPKFMGLSLGDTGLEQLRNEYATLSKAVHGSAMSFRMTVDGETTQLWSHDTARLGAWATRESATLLALNLLLVTMFRDRLAGTALPGLRKAVSLAVPTSKHARIKALMTVTLFK